MKAMIPGAIIRKSVLTAVGTSLKKALPNNENQSSSNMLLRIMNRPIKGLNQNMVAMGLFMPICSLCKSICVNAHRRPPIAEAVRTWMAPVRTNCVSAATIMMTPTVMSVMMPISDHRIFSNLNIKAKRSTKARLDDLHIAVEQASAKRLPFFGRHTHYRKSG